MKLKLGILITMLSLMLVGCSNGDIKKPAENISNGSDVEENIGSENKEEDNKEDENQESETTQVEDTEDFKIYTLDVNDTDKVLEFKNVELKKDSTVEEKLKELCDVLGEEYFKDENAKIELKSIDENNIATINLVNKDAWNQHFQGSTGGMISQATIVETLLQRDYSGEWIDGLNVVVDGATGDEFFEHAPFIETFYRNK